MGRSLGLAAVAASALLATGCYRAEAGGPLTYGSADWQLGDDAGVSMATLTFLDGESWDGSWGSRADVSFRSPAGETLTISFRGSDDAPRASGHPGTTKVRLVDASGRDLIDGQDCDVEVTTLDDPVFVGSFGGSATCEVMWQDGARRQLGLRWSAYSVGDP